jgi:hypothetical protein
VVRYFVRCSCCDRAFWLAERATLLPEHHAWERQAAGHQERTDRCEGSKNPGIWIGEGAGPISGWPREGDGALSN